MYVNGECPALASVYLSALIGRKANYFKGITMVFRWFRFYILSVALSLFMASNVDANTSLPKETLVIGSISTKPSKAFKRLNSLSLYLKVRLSEHGIRQVKIKVARDVKQMQAYIDAGEVDIFSETMLTAVKIKNIDIDLLRWKKGVDRYQTLLITHMDSDIQTINDLVGKSIALEDEGSTSGYFIPMLAITKFTDQIIKKDNVQQENIANKVNYIFSTRAYATSIDNLAIWAHRSIVDAAAISNIDWNNKRKFPEKIKRDLRIFDQSVEIPRSLTMYRSTLDAGLKRAITLALLDAHNDVQGKIALKEFAKTKKFTLLNDQEKKSIDDSRDGYYQRIKRVE